MFDGLVAVAPANALDEGRLYFRIHLRLKISQYLLTSFYFKSCTHQTWVSIKYERLLFFCFICGVLGHVFRVCPDYNDEAF